MANLDLIPKLPVLAVQAGIFVANLGIMKKLFMDPYLKVKDAQDGMTYGSQGDAARLLAEAESISDDINQRMIAAMTEAKNAREKVRADALARRQAILEASQNSAKVEIDKVELEIKTQIEAERQRIPNVIANLSTEVYNIALS